MEPGLNYLQACKEQTISAIREIIRDGSAGDERAYDLMLEYPLRRAKGLRPALCIAVCRALGGSLAEVLPAAAVLEIYHNAFLIHDDIEDGSLQRRGFPTLHQTHGIPTAINCGDGLLALTLRPLLDNTELLGVGRALRVLDIFAATATESFEGQSLELAWIADGRWELEEADYELMVLKKTCGYSFVAPALIGAAIARTEPAAEELLAELMRHLGLAFQIQDDILNLEEDRAHYGKERAGDLWEGKRTLILLHALRCAGPEERARAIHAVGKPRPTADGVASRVAGLLTAMEQDAIVDGPTHLAIASFLKQREALAGMKTEEDVAFLLDLIDAHGSLAYARAVADAHARSAAESYERLAQRLADSSHLRFLQWIIDYVVRRIW